MRPHSSKHGIMINIVFVEKFNNKLLPLLAISGDSHFATCCRMKKTSQLLMAQVTSNRGTTCKRHIAKLRNRASHDWSLPVP